MQDMLNHQLEFQQRMYPELRDTPLDQMPVDWRTAYIKEHSIHLTQELHEMLYELPLFKPWKDYSGMTYCEIMAKLDKAKEELIDTWHFFMNIALALGFTAETFKQAYLDKHHINNVRQDEGYTFDKSFREGPNDAER